MPQPSDAAIRELATKILDRPEYAQYRVDDSELWVKAMKALLTWLEELPRLHAEAPGVYWAIISTLGVVLIALVAHIIWTVTAALRVPHAAPAEDAAPVERDFAAEAAQLAERGAYLEASHQLLLASLAQAARRQVFELRAADSNRSICEKLRASRMPVERRERLIALIQRTETSWFGARESNPELYAQWRAAYDELRGAAA